MPIITDIKTAIESLQDHMFKKIFSKTLDKLNVPFPTEVEFYLEQIINDSNIHERIKLNVKSFYKNLDETYNLTLEGNAFSWIRIDGTEYTFPKDGLLTINNVTIQEGEYVPYVKIEWAPFSKTMPEGYTPKSEFSVNRTTVKQKFEGNAKDVVLTGYLLAYSLDDVFFPYGKDKPTITARGVNNENISFSGFGDGTTDFPLLINDKEYIMQYGSLEVPFYNIMKDDSSGVFVEVALNYKGKFKGVLTSTLRRDLRDNKKTEALTDPYWLFNGRSNVDTFSNKPKDKFSFTNVTTEPLTYSYLGKEETLQPGNTSTLDLYYNPTYQYLKEMPADTNSSNITIKSPELNGIWSANINSNSLILDSEYLMIRLREDNEILVSKQNNNKVLWSYNNIPLTLKKLDGTDFENSNIISYKEVFEQLKNADDNYLKVLVDLPTLYNYNKVYTTNLSFNFNEFLNIGYRGIENNYTDVTKLLIKPPSSSEWLPLEISGTNVPLTNDNLDVLLRKDMYDQGFSWKFDPADVSNPYAYEQIQINVDFTNFRTNASIENTEVINFKFNNYSYNDKETIKDYFVNNYEIALTNINTTYDVKEADNIEQLCIVHDKLWQHRLLNGSSEMILRKKNDTDNKYMNQLITNTSFMINDKSFDTSIFDNNNIFAVPENFDTTKDYIKAFNGYANIPIAKGDSNASTFSFNNSTKGLKADQLVFVNNTAINLINIKLDSTVTLGDIKVRRSDDNKSEILIFAEGKSEPVKIFKTSYQVIYSYPNNSQILVYNKEGF